MIRRLQLAAVLLGMIAIGFIGAWLLVSAGVPVAVPVAWTNRKVRQVAVRLNCLGMAGSQVAADEQRATLLRDFSYTSSAP
ncbi:MAG TPA: hypothetical protein VNO24_20635 [Blastocatellia bacterium]|nr:hypothetical protein [Blastocatellia bacterium]